MDKIEKFQAIICCLIIVLGLLFVSLIFASRIPKSENITVTGSAYKIVKSDSAKLGFDIQSKAKTQKEAYAIIKAQDSSNFIPYNETYVDPTLSEFINDVAGADNVMNYGSGGLYLISPTSRECRLINQTTGDLTGDIYGNGILDADSTITSDDGSSVEFNQGVVTYSISGQNLGFDQEDRFDGITSMEELGGKFSDAVLFSNDYLKYYNLEAVETTTTEDTAGNQYEAAQLRYGISGDTLDFVSALDEVNWAYEHSIPNGFEPFKIEITVTATFLDKTYENYTLQGEIYFYIKDVEDGGIYYIENFTVAENSSIQTYWDQYLAAEFTPVAA